MSFLPTLKLSFRGGAFNEYRLDGDKVEVRNGESNWHALTCADIRLHFILHTEVASWLRREIGNAHRASKRAVKWNRPKGKFGERTINTEAALSRPKAL